MAAHRGVGITESCSICLDTLGTTEGDPLSRISGTSSTAEGNSPLKLSTVALEQCEHLFHEHCLMKWLSPIFSPSMETELDPVLRLLEEGTDLVESLSRLPLVPIHQASIDDPVVEETTGGETDATAEQTLRESGGTDGDLEEREVGEESPISPLPTTENIPFTQALSAMNPYNANQRYIDRVLVSELPANIQSLTCPQCRQCPGLDNLDCHTDTIQLIRARFRLTNLAYQCLRFKRTYLEDGNGIPYRLSSIGGTRTALFLRQTAQKNGPLQTAPSTFSSKHASSSEKKRSGT
ncbi:MAG: hypothetical protein Q9209_006401 [Squamulea sp. 1 TL-2023]